MWKTNVESSFDVSKSNFDKSVKFEMGKFLVLNRNEAVQKQLHYIEIFTEEIY